MNYEYLKDVIVNTNDENSSDYEVDKSLGHDPFN